MIRTQAEVHRQADGQLAVEAACKTSCQTCGVNKICGGSKRSMLLELSSEEASRWQEGEQLQVDIAEEELLRLTLLAYLLPCLLLVVFALMASPWGDLATALGSVVGLAVGVLLSSWMTRRRPPQVYFQSMKHQEPEHE